MKNPTLLALSLASLLAGKTAAAESSDALEARTGFDHPVVDHPAAAPATPLHLCLASEHTQGVAPVGGGMVHLAYISSAGGVVELDGTYLINPLVAVGVYGSFSQYATGDQISDEADVRGATADVEAATQLRSVGPWISLGADQRGLWLSPGSSEPRLDLLVNEGSAMTRGYTELGDRHADFIGVAGLTGRFDLRGKR